MPALPKLGLINNTYEELKLHVMVNGKLAIKGGCVTGITSGRVLRKE